jgi:deoxyribodipyrimidine photo-lyase
VSWVARRETKVCTNLFRLHSRDHGLGKPSDLPDVFTNYRKSQEPLRERPRPVVPRPDVGTLPPYPDSSVIPPQHGPFHVANSLEDLRERLLKPVKNPLENPPPFPAEARSAHPFQGGESNARKRLTHLIRSGAMTAYKETRNGLIGPDFSSKLSAYLSLGCVSARQVHDEMLKFENGTESAYESAKGYGQGENDGTRGVRFELLWRDYMRLCTIKFGSKLFRLEGFRQGPVYNSKWLMADRATAQRHQNPSADKVDAILRRLWAGTTGMGFIDASQRELLHTGYTSNRARQNVASFLSKHLQIDWRYGAEWYEMMLVDYDVSSNWSNWQYVAGVGNDPRGDARIFNPVKQAFDYDKDGMYVRTWVPEVSGLEKLENVFQPWTASITDLEACGLLGNIAVTNPIKRIEFMVDKKPRQPRKSSAKKRGQGRGGGRRGGGGGGDGGSEPRNNTYSGGRNGHDQGYANDPGSFNGFGTSQGWNGNYQSAQPYSMHQEHQQPPMSSTGDYTGTYNNHVDPQAFHQQVIPHNNMYPQAGYDNQPWFYKNGNSNGYKGNRRGGPNGGSRGRRGGRGGHGFANQGQDAHGQHYDSFGPPPGYYPPYNGRDV